MAGQVFSKSMHGREIAVAVNEPFTVELEEIASTGFRWHVEPVPGLALISSSSVPLAGRGVGGGRHRQFVMTATTPGKIPLRARLWRDWEGEPSVIERFEITVRAH
jgi:inhibitor of cysteine peptidase